MDIRWLSAFFDFPAVHFGAEVTFWRAIAGSTVSPPRGARKEFASLEPFNGDPHLRVQRIDSGSGGVHLDFHVTDVDAAGAEAEVAGGEVLSAAEDLIVIRSPGGLRFCLTSWLGENTRSRPIRWPGASISLIDEVTLGVERTQFADEVDFFTTITGWAPTDRPVASDPVDSVRLTRPDPLPLAVLLSPSDGACAEVGIAATSVPEEVARHRDWGATVLAEEAGRVLMADPVGYRYRITARNPRTGV